METDLQPERGHDASPGSHGIAEKWFKKQQLSRKPNVGRKPTAPGDREREGEVLLWGAQAGAALVRNRTGGARLSLEAQRSGRP